MKYKGYEIDNITVEDMPNSNFETIAVLCGVDAAVSLLTNMQGNTIIVPTRGLDKVEKKIILQKYDGDPMTIKELARNLVRSERYIRDVLAQYKIEPVVDGQLRLFKEEKK